MRSVLMQPYSVSGTRYGSGLFISPNYWQDLFEPCLCISQVLHNAPSHAHFLERGVWLKVSLLHR